MKRDNNEVGFKECRTENKRKERQLKRNANEDGFKEKRAEEKRKERKAKRNSDEIKFKETRTKEHEYSLVLVAIDYSSRIVYQTFIIAIFMMI